jgi:mannose-6-phosphate isomerase-like protein (cupin superfamily)
MPNNIKEITVGEHCIGVASGDEWRNGTPGEFNYTGHGTAFDQIVTAEPNVKEEEIATVLEGSFLIQADDESYEITVGEGILIPPSTHRTWTCLTERGTLYRVLTLDQPEVAYTPLKKS